MEFKGEKWPASHQGMVAAFPQLLTERRGPRGWKESVCSQGSSSAAATATCYHHDGTDMSFSVMDYLTIEAVQRQLDEAYLYDYAGSRGKIPAPAKPAPHPMLPAEALATLPEEGASARITGDVYFSFPNDPGRERYIISVKWRGHSQDEVLKYWWAEAPLGK
ncbi:hypothetical protein [Nocardia sp. NPDC051832]|uniref:hypothetical protein n=1 Tax=Nocardia sp. NPDC051832 TaxID=3155673 RepID=UPI003440531F